MVNLTRTITVWDYPTRLGHWLLVTSFIVAYLSAESERWRLVHVFSGCAVLGVVSFRLVWGFAGSRYARFSSFLVHPRRVVSYLRQSFSSAEDPSVGHNPAGGWSVILLLLFSLATALTGLLTYNGWLPSRWAEWHEFVTHLTVLWIGLHLLGVIVGSLLHRENLVAAMITGNKTVHTTATSIRHKHGWAAFILLAWVLGLAYFLGTRT